MPNLMGQMSPEQQQKWVKKALNYEIFGCYAQVCFLFCPTFFLLSFFLSLVELGLHPLSDRPSLVMDPMCADLRLQPPSFPRLTSLTFTAPL